MELTIRKLTEISVRFIGISFLLYTLPAFFYYSYLFVCSVADKIFVTPFNQAGIVLLSALHLIFLGFIYVYFLRYGKWLIGNLTRQLGAEDYIEAVESTTITLFTKCIGIWFLVLSLRKVFTVIAILSVNALGFTNEFTVSMDQEANETFRTLLFSHVK
jgi:hypothetical protein